MRFSNRSHGPMPCPKSIRALKGRLGHFARPEGRDEPFRARVFAEPALQRTDPSRPTRVRSLLTIFVP
jgi:hypothetical protein